MGKKFFILFLAIVIALVNIGSAEASHVSCGQTITNDTILDSDLICTGSGLIVGASNITLDCDGHTISGNETGSIGIYVLNHQNITIKKCVVQSFRSSGIFILNSNNNTLQNITANNNSFHGSRGIYLTGNNNTLSDINANHNYFGLMLAGSYNNFSYINAKNNSGGIYINGLYSSTFQYINANDNLNGFSIYQASGNTFQEINANNNSAYAFFLLGTGGNTFSSITANNNRNAFSFINYANGNTLQNISANNNIAGFSFYEGSGNILQNISANNNTQGFSLYASSSSNIFENIQASHNSFGFYIFLYSDFNTISYSKITSNNVGIFIAEPSRSNTVFNNYFADNTVNVNDTDGFNFWNITKTPGTNIVGGSFLGGNYWDDYNGADINGDGLGDTDIPYNSSGNIRYGGDVLPLIPNEIVCRTGNVNIDGGYIADTLIVNGQIGDNNRVIEIPINTPINITMLSPPSNQSAKFAMYAWLGEPTNNTVTQNPNNLGMTCFPTPLTIAKAPQPVKIWNNVGFKNLLGIPNMPSDPAPSTVLYLPNGRPNPETFTIQGIIMDDNSGMPLGYSVTNAVIIKVNYHPTPGPLIRLTFNSNVSMYPHITSDSFGSSHIVWYENEGQGQNSLYYTKLDNNGTTLIDDKRIFNQDVRDQEFFRIDRDNNNDIYILVGSAAGLQYLRLDSLGNVVFGPLVLPFARKVSDIAVEKDTGAVHIVTFKEPAGGTIYQKIGKNGNVLVGETQIAPASYPPSIALDSNRNAHIFWWDTQQNPKFRYSKVDSSGTIVIDNLPIQEEGGVFAVYTNAAVDRNNSVHALAQRNYAKISSSGEILMEKTIPISVNYYNPIAINKNNPLGIIHVAAIDGENIYYSLLDNDGNFLIDQILLLNTPGGQVPLDSAVDNNDNLHLAFSWMDASQQNPNQEIYYQKVFIQDL